jgi:hypothetical protein
MVITQEIYVIEFGQESKFLFIMQSYDHISPFDKNTLLSTNHLQLSNPARETWNQQEIYKEKGKKSDG